MSTRSAQQRAARKMWEIERTLADSAEGRPRRIRATPQPPAESPLGESIAQTLDLEAQVDSALDLLHRFRSLTRAADDKRQGLLSSLHKHREERDRLQSDLERTREETAEELSRLQAAMEGGREPAWLGDLEEVSSELVEAMESGHQLDIARRAVEEATVRNLTTAIDARERLGELGLRVVVAEARFGRVRARRAVRLLDVFAEWGRRPWRVASLLPRLRKAWERVPLPEVPSVAPPVESLISRKVAAPAAKEGRLLAYPGLRIAHAGPLRTFQSVAPLMAVSEHDWVSGLEMGYDMLLVEPGSGPADIDIATVGEFRKREVPVVFAARATTHLEHEVARAADVIVTFDPHMYSVARRLEAETVRLWPSVDDTAHNPIGWIRQPPHGILVISDHNDLGPELSVVEPIAQRIHIHGRAITGLNRAAHNPQRPIGTDLDATAKQHLGAYVSARLATSHASYLQLALELTASGTPVIASRSPDLDELLAGHYLPADTPAELQQALQQLSDITTRERLSVPARRHVLTTHTRRHQLERLLQHLHIPTSPPDRISILLATNRPDHLEHALENITRQNWPNKELLLILHGKDRFDLDQINQTLTNLPYPTQLIPCPADWTLGDCLNSGLDHATGQYITKMDDDDHYGPHHLTDLHTAHTYSNATITGKWRSHTYLSEFDMTVRRNPIQAERYRDHVSGASLMMGRSSALSYRFLRRNGRVDSTLFERVLADGGSLYVTHSLGFIVTRNPEGHTWKVPYDRFVVGAVMVESGVSSTILEAS